MDPIEATEPSTEPAPEAITPEVNAPALEFTPEQLKAALDAAGADAFLSAELEASKRSRGHISALQKRLDAAEKTLARIDTVELTARQTADRLDKVLSGLPEGVLDANTIASLRPQDNETITQLNARIDALAAQLEAANTPKQEDEPLDPEKAQAVAQWNSATAMVKQYATSKGIELDDNDPQWGRAYRANPDDPSVAAIELMRHIDGLVEQKARRGEREDAAKGGADGSRTTRTGSVSLDQLKKMSREEIRALDPKVVEAAMAGV